ncbi:MAG: HK97 gp10 family phage protein [Oscillospiraceae bacterium]|nr:HK97 gp10 family phage protein [Oscillospiraceae bacterium]
MPDVTFEDYTLKIQKAIEDRAIIALEEVAGEIEAQAIKNTPVGKVNGGNTKGHWEHRVDEENLEAVIGHHSVIAIYNEFGTGEYALEGNGRKGGWYIPIGEGENEIPEAVVKAYGFKVVYGKDGKKFAFTTGMEPKRPLFNAFEKKKSKVKNIIRKRLGGKLEDA